MSRKMFLGGEVWGIAAAKNSTYTSHWTLRKGDCRGGPVQKRKRELKRRSPIVRKD